MKRLLVALPIFLMTAAAFYSAWLLGSGAAEMVRDNKTARASAAWATAAGTITHAQIVVNEMATARGRHVNVAEADIAYSYATPKGTFESTRVTFGVPPDAEILYARYPEHARVTVHYDPAQPSNAVLEAGVEVSLGAIAFMAAFSFVLLVIGVVLARLTVKIVDPR